VPSLGAIADADSARALIAHLCTQSVIALDTEGDGMFRYRTRLCALQLGSSAQLAVVDTLQLPAELFAELLGAGGPEKVIHDAAFDARLLAAHGAVLGFVFDTAVAARFLGFASTGLSSLLLALFGIKLPKELQQADWGERPLSDEAITYLENDVRYLLPLRDVLLEQVRARDIEPEVREECAYVLAEAENSELEPSPFARVKGASARPPQQRARLYELALARDSIARELDVPAARVVPNDLLLRLAELEQPSESELERRLSAKMRAHAPRFHQALARASEQHDAPASELTQPGHDMPTSSELALRKRRRELLTTFRAQEALARGVEPQAVLPGHCVTDLVKLPTLERSLLTRVPGLGQCRIERYAERWERELGARWR
jgi:ribonuclease D